MLDKTACKTGVGGVCTDRGDCPGGVAGAAAAGTVETGKNGRSGVAAGTGTGPGIGSGCGTGTCH